MNRVKLLIGILLLAVIMQWVVTLISVHRLPSEIPWMFTPAQTDSYIAARGLFYLFPAISTGICLVMLGLYPLRDKMSFPGKKKLSDLPSRLKIPVINKAFQIINVLVAYLIVSMAYVQIALALLATGLVREFDLFPLLAIVVLAAGATAYILFDVNKKAREAREFFESLKSNARMEGAWR